MLAAARCWLPCGDTREQVDLECSREHTQGPFPQAVMGSQQTPRWAFLSRGTQAGFLLGFGNPGGDSLRSNAVVAGTGPLWRPPSSRFLPQRPQLGPREVTAPRDCPSSQIPPGGRGGARPRLSRPALPCPAHALGTPASVWPWERGGVQVGTRPDPTISNRTLGGRPAHSTHGLPRQCCC